MIRTLVNWNPRSEFEQFNQVMDRMWTSMLESSPAGAASTAMPLDVYELEGVLYVKASVPGVRPEDVEVSIEKDVLTIRGETKSGLNEHDEKLKVYRNELRYGSFTRSIRLPQNLDLENVEATFDHGFVTIRLPRREEPKPEALRVPVKQAQMIEQGAPSLEQQDR